ncbi:MAG TPA: putative 2OG-Fe(II) oxygenase [Allosphingosinicella sp.]|nr:putative 2OG-Fe(II) oxygenase [Allosphingosinicella sp.]
MASLFRPPGLAAAGRVDPRDADAAFNAGIDALSHGGEAAALRLVAKAVQHHPRDPRLWQVIGLIHRALEDLEPAVAALRKAAALAPHDARIAHALARARLEAGLPATEAFLAAHRLAPLDGGILLGLAAAQAAEGHAAAAMRGIDGQLQANPGWLAGHALLAGLRWMHDDRAGFTASYEQALARAPRDIALWRELIVTLMHADLYGEALAAIARGRAAAGPHVMFDANEAICVAEMGETERADRLFAALPPTGDATVLVRRIRHLLRSGRPAEAAALAEPLLGGGEAYLLWPYVATAWRLLGDARWHWLEGQPGLVGVYDLADRIPSLDALARRLRALHVAPGQPLEQSVRGGTQTDGPLFARIEPEIRALRKAVVAAVEQHVAGLPPPDPKHPTLRARHGPIRFSGSWSVRLLAAGHHANHIHPMGWFSSALYVALPMQEESGPPPAGWLTLGQPQAELGVPLDPFRLIEPKPGRLVLFPSTMWHGTMPIVGGERMTVAFDVAPPR